MIAQSKAFPSWLNRTVLGIGLASLFSDWSHEIAPWIVFFQNVDAIVGPDEAVVYP